MHASLARRRTVFYTPGVLTTPRLMKDELGLLTQRTSICIDQHLVEIGARPGGYVPLSGGVFSTPCGSVP
ncbi:hypothetical protein IWX62_003268 [Arthrobacter sp. CAN_A1]